MDCKLEATNCQLEAIDCKLGAHLKALLAAGDSLAPVSTFSPPAQDKGRRLAAIALERALEGAGSFPASLASQPASDSRRATFSKCRLQEPIGIGFRLAGFRQSSQWPLEPPRLERLVCCWLPFVCSNLPSFGLIFRHSSQSSSPAGLSC